MLWQNITRFKISVDWWHWQCPPPKKKTQNYSRLTRWCRTLNVTIWFIKCRVQNLTHLWKNLLQSNKVNVVWFDLVTSGTDIWLKQISDRTRSRRFVDHPVHIELLTRNLRFAVSTFLIHSVYNHVVSSYRHTIKFSVFGSILHSGDLWIVFVKMLHNFPFT